jgi:hypothetical protein
MERDIYAVLRVVNVVVGMAYGWLLAIHFTAKWW